MMDATNESQGQTPQEALEVVMASLEVVLRDQVKTALESLKDASEEAARQAADILSKMTAMGGQMLRKEVDAVSAEVAIEHFLAGLELLIQAEANAARVKAAKEGVALLKTVKSSFFLILKVALNYYVPGAGVWVDALGLDKIIDEVLPSELP